MTETEMLIAIFLVVNEDLFNNKSDRGETNAVHEDR